MYTKENIEADLRLEKIEKRKDKKKFFSFQDEHSLWFYARLHFLEDG